MPAAYFLYARKSTDEDDKQIMSIDSQLYELREFAQREGLHVVEEFVEARTAKHPGRPVFNLMMEQVEAGRADGLLAWHPDRLARNSVDGGRAIYLLDLGKLTDLRFPTYRFENTAQGKFMLSIAFGQSKYYVDSLSENVKRGYREKLRRGGWPGLAPLGYLNDEVHHTIVVDGERALLVKKLFEIYATGEYTLDEIEREAGRLGLRSKSGKPVRRNVLAKMLTNPFYYGVMRFNGEYHEGSHPPLLSKSLFDRVQQALSLRSKPQHRGKVPFSFTGFLRCGECGCMVTAEIQKGHVYYHCTKKRGACCQKYLREEALLAQIRDALLKVSLDDEAKEAMLTHWQGQASEASNASLTRSRQIAERLEVCDSQMERLLDFYVAREIDAAEYQGKKVKLLGEKQELKEALGDLERGSGGWLEPAKAFLTTCHEAGSVARHGAPRTQRQLLKTIGSNLILNNRTLSLTYNSPFQLLAERVSDRKWGPLSPSAANQPPLIWDPDMEEAGEEPPYLILPNEYFTIYEHGRRNLLSGRQPATLDGQRGIRARAWRAYQHRMSQEPPWERAERYRRTMLEQRSHSIRALAKATGEDHSRMARILKVLELPERVLNKLQIHAHHARVRAHFTEKRLRQLVRDSEDETTILHEIDQVVQAPG